MTPRFTDSFQFWFTQDIFKETKKIRKTVAALFEGEYNDKRQAPNANNGNSKNTENGGNDLMFTKCIDFMNRYPILSSLADTYIRWNAHKHHQYWEENKYYILQDMLGHEQKNDGKQPDEPEELDPGDWYDSQKKVYGNFCHSVKQCKIKGYYGVEPNDFIRYGLKCIIKRILPKFRFNWRVTNKIHDSYNTTTKIAIAMNKWVYDKTMSVNTIDDKLKYFPMQIDLWMIPRLVKTSESNKTHASKLINNEQFNNGWSADKNESNEAKSEEGAEILNLSSSQQFIWDIEDQLQYEYEEQNEDDTDSKEERDDDDEDVEIEVDPDDRNWQDGYIKDEDYFINDKYNFDEMTVQEIYKAINELWEIHNDREKTLKGHIGWKNKSFRRYILIIDRRNPFHIRNEEMMDDTNARKTWNDKMYLIEPKKSYTISKQYAYVLNETFASNTYQYLLPMFEQKDGKTGEIIKYEDKDDLGGGDDVNGYKIMISYHLFFREKVKQYFYQNQSALRFYLDDVKWLWPRLFKLDGDQFQKLTQYVEKELERALREYKLKDRDFERFLKSSIANQNGKTWHQQLMVEDYNW